MMEQDARPRAGFANLHSGGAGAPPGPTTGACQELADGGPLRFARGSEGAIDPEGVARSGLEAKRSGSWAKRGPAPR